MRLLRIGAVALFAVAWIALAVSLVGVLQIPRRYCNELPEPAGDHIASVGLLVVLGAGALGATVAGFARFSPRVVLLTSCATLAAFVGV
jgi:hypothetical protein